eukprot:TRINITY_DN3185_c0_g1_i2.p1 TRINITY_DN3185_c0_g1~~TRINITY_DN3185_c0_g1_i2.p1  ORF type:complete len:605 (-),score=106.01 TRINITY_DN3185_c0_g1_i2:99-1913(-)
MESKKSTASKLKPYLLPHLPLFCFLCVVIYFNAYIDSFLPKLYRSLVDKALPNQDVEQIIEIVTKMTLITIGIALFTVSEDYITTYLGETVSWKLRGDLFSRMQHMPIYYFGSNKRGSFLSLFNNELIGAQTTISNTIPRIVDNVIRICFTMYIILGMNWKLSIIAIAVLPLVQIPTRYVSKKMKEMELNAHKARTEMNECISDTLSSSGILLLSTFGGYNFSNSSFSLSSSNVKNIMMKKSVYKSTLFQALAVIVSFGSMGIYFFGGIFYVLYSEYNKTEATPFSIGDVLAFSGYLGRLYSPINDLSTIHVEIDAGLLYFEKILNYLQDAEKYNVVEKGKDFERISSCKGEISFHNVTYSYPSSLTPSIDDVSFTIQPGQLVIIVGLNGAGKTTLAHLVMRLLTPTNGEVRLDNINLQNLSMDGIRTHITILTQEVYLLHDTIKMNLIIANPSASDEKITEACKIAGIHEFIMSLPNGYDTVVGERGNILSGGQKKLISIARVILRRDICSVVILDEHTTHLDSLKASHLQNEIIFQEFSHHTRIIISHNTSDTLLNRADKIIVMDKGKIVQMGTQKELMSDENGLYCTLIGNPNQSKIMSDE